MLLEFADFNALLQRSKVLMEDRHGIKVLATPDGGIVKLFRRKRLLSSALWDPYATRFARNAVNLKKLGIPTVEVTGVWRVSPLKRDAVVYRRMEGESLRDLEKTDARMEQFARFVAELHAKGVFSVRRISAISWSFRMAASGSSIWRISPARAGRWE